jgi:hypothetical protein
VPQILPWAAHVVGTQTHLLATLQTSGGEQVPQSSVPPHPSGIVPQVAPWAVQLVGVQPH